ncbi:acyltransferase family protein [Paraburkholderia sacchari]|uniref:acyltransferase family protein n=1 Tax=Paraburkholderia sacchari TaxID=159450 RepID=UPI003D9722F5
MSGNSGNRIKGLDGLRALAVLSVFFGHTGLTPVKGGYIGVEVFFILSGFLITRLLAAEHSASGRIDFLAFYGRRARRLYPALFGLLAAVALYCASEPKLDARMEITPALFYFMNWVRAFGGYDAVLTGHTWSLAIEEQFYLLWPLALLALFWMRRATLGVVILAVVALVWRAHLMKGGATDARIYGGFDTHAAGLLLGALMAFMPAVWLRRAGHLWVPGAAFLIAVLFSDAAIGLALSPYGFAFANLAASVVIARVVTVQESLLVSNLNAGWLAGLGRVSYGFYLWHYPVIHVMLYGGHDSILAFFGSLEYPKVAMVAATFFVSLALTLASWFIIEKPCMRFRMTRRVPAL